MRPSATAFSLFSVRITWMHMIAGGFVLIGLYILFFSLVLEKSPKIHIGAAFRKAFCNGGRQFGALLRFMTAELSLTLICLTPMLFLFEKDIRFLAGLTVPVWILFMFPVRMNAAAAMQEALDGGSLFTYRLLDMSGWAGKVWFGTKRALLLLVWMSPLIAALIYAYRLYTGMDDVDAFKLLQMIQDFGDGDVKSGFQNLILILLMLLTLLVIGFAFHSTARHAKVLDKPEMMNGHHGKVVLGWFCSLVILWPMIIMCVVIAGVFAPLLSDPNSLVMDGGPNLPPMKILLIIVGVGSLLSLPLMPFRSLVIAAMARQAGEDGTSKA